MNAPCDSAGIANVPSESGAARRQRIVDRAERLFIAAMRTEGLRLASTEDADRMARLAFERARQFEDIADSMPEARVTTLPLGRSPLASLLLLWAHGAEPELRAGDLVRLHEDVEALLREAGVDPEHVQRVCGHGPPRWPNGAAGGACDAGTKSDAASSYQPEAASQE